MIYNEKLASLYGDFPTVSGKLPPVAQKNKPTKDNYNTGYVPRFFVKKVNENRIMETTSQGAANINESLYKVVSLRWKISGPKNNVFKDGILDKNGVEEANKFEINRIKKEEDVDLSTTLTNLLEYWRGF